MKVVATTLVSNSLGTVTSVDRLVPWAHEQGAIVVVDGRRPRRTARSTSGARLRLHRRLRAQDVRSERCGRAVGPAELLQAMEPFNLGGHMIRSVKREETTWGDLPHKFEAGTSPIAEAVGFGAAIDYLNEIGLDGDRAARARARRVRASTASPSCRG